MGVISSFIARRWKIIVNIVTIGALILFVFAIRHQLVETWNNLGDVQLWVLLFIIPVQMANYDAQARLYRALFVIVGNKFAYRKLYETALELNFVNNVFPSGGVSGISYFGMRMRSGDVTAGKAALVQLMKLVLLFLSFEILLGIGLLFLAIEGNINSLLLLITAVFSTALILGTMVLVYVLGSKQRVSAFYVLIRSAANALMRAFARGKVPRQFKLERLKFLLDELYENFVIIKERYKELKRPLLFALFANTTEILTIYTVYVAFGYSVNPGAIILAYSVANVAGFISILPGGVGIYEAIMTTVLVAAGIPVAISLPVTIMYRVLSSTVQLPAGYYFYHRTIHNGNVLEPERV
jgi:putative heme transporter